VCIVFLMSYSIIISFFFLLFHSFSFFSYVSAFIDRLVQSLFFYITLSRTHTRTHQSSRLMKKKTSDDCYRVFCSFSIDLNEYTNRIYSTYVTYLSLPIEFYLYINTLLSVNRNNSFNDFCFGYRYDDIEMNNIDTFCFLQ
jgi:hypothetical protein